LWNYEGLDKEPPLVYFSSEGETEFLASTFAEYLISLPYFSHDYTINDFLSSEDYVDILDLMVDDYEEKKGKRISEQAMTLRLKADVANYIVKAKKTFSFTTNTFEQEKAKFDDFIKVMMEF